MLETKIRNLIDKHQTIADQNHRISEEFYNMGKFEKAAEWDKRTHMHEAIALELRMALHE